MLTFITPILLFIAFVLLVLVSLSVPIDRDIYLFKITANASSSLFKSGVSGAVKFGVWGYCFSGADVSVLGSQHDTAASCSKAKLGYTFDQTLASELHINGLENLISRTLTAALVLHPIACGLTFLAFLVSLAMAKRNSEGSSRLASFFTLGAGILAALVTSIIFFVDVGLVAATRHKISKDTDGDLQLDFGDGVWIVLAAAIAIWASLIGACAGLCCRGRHRGPTSY